MIMTGLLTPNDNPTEVPARKLPSFNVQVCKWGHANGIRIPTAICKAISLKPNQTLRVRLCEGFIVMEAPGPEGSRVLSSD